MALEALAKLGNFFHVYDFRVKPGSGDEFIRLFNAYDYSDDNPMHKSHAQVKDGVETPPSKNGSSAMCTILETGIFGSI